MLQGEQSETLRLLLEETRTGQGGWISLFFANSNAEVFYRPHIMNPLWCLRLRIKMHAGRYIVLSTVKSQSAYCKRNEVIKQKYGKHTN